MKKVLWLHSKGFSSAQRSMLENYMRKIKLNPAHITFSTMHMRVQNMLVRKGKSQLFIANPDKKKEFFNVLDEYLERTQAEIIVVNDSATLEYITGYGSLDLCRGSTYRYSGKPVIVVNDVLAARAVTHGPWVLLSDLSKVKRWMEDAKRQEPKFSYRVTHTLQDLQAAQKFLCGCFIMSCDIETAAGFITCIGYTGLNAAGQVQSWVIPFYNPTKAMNQHWETEADEVAAWFAVRAINDCAAFKVFQNGQYDCSYLARYRCPPRNYFLDSLHLWHSFWTEAPKKLNFISSMLLDSCRYWKDESKGETKDKDKNERVPSDPVGLEMYWRYNALDCHNTLLCAAFLVQLIMHPNNAWALSNYNVEFRLQIGPAFAMSMRGMKANRKRILMKDQEWQKEYRQSLIDLRKMCDDQEFNPNSPQQVASLLYDVLGATPIKQRGKQGASTRSVDEKLLKMIRLQHPLYAMFIDKIWDVKKALNNSAKYGDPSKLLDSWTGRFVYGLSAAGTETGRFASKGHHFWVGTNAQNIPAKSRDMFVADDGYLMVEVDYSQSDAYFVAFESEDQKYMANICDDRDTHSVHCEMIYNIPYEKIMANIKEDWVAHPLKGVRQNTKRITHGANYRMSAHTLYMTMGREAVVASAVALGKREAPRWDEKQLVNFCGFLLKLYLKGYPGIERWFASSVEEVASNGNRATCAFGRTRLFFGNLRDDAKLQRELSAYYGQGGTAGNINRTLLVAYYKSGIEQEGLMLLNQVHDSIVFQVPVNKLELIKKFLTIMEQPCIVRGREFTVPAEAECGFSWKAGFVPYNDEFAIEQAVEKEAKVRGKYE